VIKPVWVRKLLRTPKRPTASILPLPSRHVDARAEGEKSFFDLLERGFVGLREGTRCGSLDDEENMGEEWRWWSAENP
jgi:hypothetical protein